MLTVRYDRLGTKPGDSLLDLGAGGGRHAFEAMRRGASVVALDADAGEMKDVSWMMRGLIQEDGAVTDNEGRGAAVTGDALRLPFRSGSFDRAH